MNKMDTQWRSELKVTGESLAKAIENQDHSYRSLAAAVAAKLATKPFRDRGAPQGCSHEWIGQLVREQAKSVHPERARAVEAVLDRKGELFRVCMRPNSQTRTRDAAARVA